MVKDGNNGRKGGQDKRSKRHPHANEQTIIWRNNENTIWLSQTRTWIGNKITKTKIKISFPNFFSFMQMSNIQTKFNGLLSAGHYSL